MSKIVNRKTKEIVKEDENLMGLFLVTEFLDENDISCYEYESLTELIATMTGDAITPFDTVGEMIEEIPWIVNAGEENGILEVFAPHSIDWYNLGWGYGEDTKVNNEILHSYFPGYDVEE